MQTLLLPRQQGKTSALIKKADNYNGYIICKDKNRADYVMQRAKKMSCNINYPITFNEFINKQYYGRGIKSFYIDDADDLLRYLSNVPIIAITLTDDLKEEIKE